jgi:hypothetical protein
MNAAAKFTEFVFDQDEKGLRSQSFAVHLWVQQSPYSAKGSTCIAAVLVLCLISAPDSSTGKDTRLDVVFSFGES